MTLNGVMALILRYFAKFGTGSFRGPYYVNVIEDTSILFATQM